MKWSVESTWTLKIKTVWHQSVDLVFHVIQYILGQEFKFPLFRQNSPHLVFTFYFFQTKSLKPLASHINFWNSTSHFLQLKSAGHHRPMRYTKGQGKKGGPSNGATWNPTDEWTIKLHRWYPPLHTGNVIPGPGPGPGPVPVPGSQTDGVCGRERRSVYHKGAPWWSAVGDHCRGSEREPPAWPDSLQEHACHAMPCLAFPAGLSLALSFPIVCDRQSSL